MEFYIYRIGNITIGLRLPFDIQILKESQEFLVKTSEQPCDIQMDFLAVDELEALPEDGVWMVNQYHIQTLESRKIYHCPHTTKPPYLCVEWLNPKEVKVRYLRSKEHILHYSQSIVDLFGLETLLLQSYALLLHASFIEYQEEGILFSAPSGTGKSTQADLWKKYEHARIINGDKVGIRKIDQKWQAFGLPYAGSSEIYHCDCKKIKCIVVLAKAKYNRITKLNGIQSFQKLYPELTINHSSSIYTHMAFDLLNQVIENVPIYFLECLPNEEAVKLLKAFMNREESL